MNLPLLIDSHVLHTHLQRNDLLIIDLSPLSVYEQGHVPGAIHLPPAMIMGGKQPAVGCLPDTAQLQRALQAIGLNADAHVVVYDNEGGGWAGRMMWVMDTIGHPQCSYLNGGIHAWIAAGYGTETAIPTPQPTSMHITLAPEQPSVDQDFILQHLNDPEIVIWDARSAEEYTGLRVSAKNAGHIPGAINYEWTRALNVHDHLKIRDLDQVRSELYDLGIRAEHTVITHCQTHHRSGFTYMLGKVLGFPNIKAYPGSWSEWGNDERLPFHQQIEHRQ